MNRKLFYIGNFVILGLFVAAMIQDNDREWKHYQKEYRRLEVERVTSELEKAANPQDKARLETELASAKSMPIGLRQVMVNDLGRFDRCISCHVGMDPVSNPAGTTPYKEHPFKAGEIAAHQQHNINKIGCTSCHSGQGLATEVKPAHGWLAHWEKPMMSQPYMQGMCMRCHGDLNTPGMEQAKLGKDLMDKLGCIGCHSIKGKGGEVSVDLGDIADKPVARIHWGHTHLEHDDWNVKNWIEMHLTKDPWHLVPGDPNGEMCSKKAESCEPIPPSGMPNFNDELKPEEAAAITAYLMSMTENAVPANYYVQGNPPKKPRFANATARGKWVFDKHGCAGCHGEGGAKGRRNFNALCDNQTKMEDGCEPTLTKVVGTYSREELREKLHIGVTDIKKFNEAGPTPPLYMPAWKDKIKGQDMEDLITYLLSIGEKDEEEW
jgi:mono/diheme cytochrome c family protein